MGQQFCTACGAKIGEGKKFCEACGSPVGQPQGSMPQPPASSMEEIPQPTAAAGRGWMPSAIIAGIIIVLIAAAAAIIILPGLDGGTLSGTTTPVPTPVPTTPPATVVTIPVTTIPTTQPDPFPDALALKELFSYNEGKYASRATVYRYWMNETYQWHNDKDNRYYVQRPSAGYQYLFVFVNIENLGTDGYPYPKTSMIVVHYGGNVYRVDTSHFLPDIATDRDARPIEIRELEKQSDFFNMELVEDYGYSHGTTQDFVYPGRGNAVDGYIIYEVPESLTPEKTRVEIVFDGQDRAVWKLG